MTQYHARDLASSVMAALRDMPVVVITGMRQTGKSTFLQTEEGFQSRRYVTFDDFAYLEAAKRDPEGFIESEADMDLTIDEAQKCPEILTAIKRAVGRKRRPGRFLLSGSANFGLIKGLSETLAGRAVYFTMHPFSRREALERTGEKPFLQGLLETEQIPKYRIGSPLTPAEIKRGGMPSVCLGEVTNSDIWFKGYEQTYLERDVRELSQVGNIIAFRNLLRLACLRTGSILSVSELARDAKLNVATTSRYLSLFEASFIIYRLPPYLKNRASRLIKSPKLYFGDSGLADYLCGTERVMNSLAETYVAQNLMSILDAHVGKAELSFWNVQGRHEVDFVIEVGKRCVAVEVKNAARWDGRDLSGLKAFLETTPHCFAGIIAYNGTETVRLEQRLWAVPLSLLLS